MDAIEILEAKITEVTEDIKRRLKRAEFIEAEAREDRLQAERLGAQLTRLLTAVKVLKERPL